MAADAVAVLDMRISDFGITRMDEVAVERVWGLEVNREDDNGVRKFAVVIETPDETLTAAVVALAPIEAAKSADDDDDDLDEDDEDNGKDNEEGVNSDEENGMDAEAEANVEDNEDRD